MKKLNLRRISEILSEKELKNVLAGCGGGTGSGTCTYCKTRADCSPSQLCSAKQGQCDNLKFCW